MKTNEWLAYFVAEHKSELLTLLETEAPKVNIETNAFDLGLLLTALEKDFDAETSRATANEFSDLNDDRNSIKILWSKVAQKLIGYISGEEDLTGGAKRLAYLRLSTFTQELNSAWA